MAGEVDFEVYLYGSVAAEFLDAEEVGWGPGEVGAVGVFGGEGGEGGDLQGPGLGVGGVEVEAVELLEGHGVEGADDVVGGDVVSRNV